MTDSKHIEITSYSFLVALANDDTIDEDELAFIKELALKDGKIDDQERQVLANLFARIERVDHTEAEWREIADFKTRYSIS